MNEVIQKEVEILWSGEEYSIEQKLEAFERLKKAATEKDLPQLIQLLESDRNDFWTRELLCEPVITLGGSDYFPQLFDAYILNENDGHDNDTLNLLLTELAESDPNKNKEILTRLSLDSKYKDLAEWLLDYCKQNGD